MSDCVHVAVNIRPLITHELIAGCSDCITATPFEPQVQIGTHSFTYDYVYGCSASPFSNIYKECVEPLVSAFFQGYNATVLAYGQTGSGKTYTMGTNYTGQNDSNDSTGIIPQVMDSIFKKTETMKDMADFLIRVSFIEIFKEEVFDLLETKPVPIQIRETGSGGGVSLAGVTEPEVCSKEEMTSFLARGSASRATASTNMNSQSSRSHAIFTITMEQKKNNGASKGDICNDILCSKLHLVDLAGSERAKRTGADGLRLKEGIHINRGLLSLGNVISALGDEKKRKEGGHVPYRDSKLTRLLQDSLGGNSKTIMIACVSPADTNAEETINTLKYANRARNIQNKAVVNRDPVVVEMQRMRSQVEKLQAELLCFKSGSAPLDEIQVLLNQISLLEESNSELRQRVLQAEVEKDKLSLKLDSLRKGKAWEEFDNIETEEMNAVQGYLSKIHNLEMEIMRLRSVSSSNNITSVGCLDLNDDSQHLNIAFHESLCGEIDEQKELEHCTLQEKLGKELQELDKQLEEKEEEMKLVSTENAHVLKQHYEKKLSELENEKKFLLKEIEDLRINHNIPSMPDAAAKKLKESYLQKLNALESQVSDLKKKQEAHSHLLRQKQKSDEVAKRLNEEIHRIKSQKVQLQHKIKQDSEQFRALKASREKEVLQLKKEGRRNEYEMHKLQALNHKQKMVLQRKTEEAALATKKLKEALDSKKTSREISGSSNINERGLQAIEHELEVTLMEHKVRSEYQKQLEARAAISSELSRLKDEYEKFRQRKLSDYSSSISPSARNSRISALQNMLASCSSTLVSMASQLSEAEERRTYGVRGLLNHIRSLPEAKNLIKHLLNVASTARCQLQDNVSAFSEKNSEIRELKEKIVLLNCSLRELEAQNSKMRLQDMVPADMDVDMDTSDSDTEFQPSHTEESESESESGWSKYRKKIQKKRLRKSAEAKKFSPKVIDTSKDVDVRGTSDPDVSKSEINACCSCSKSSSCKTKKCECRSANNSCGANCGCVLSKCTNREEFCIIKDEEKSEFETEDLKPKDRTAVLATQGVMLLQSALVENSVSEIMPQRKVLSDIGNKLVNDKSKKTNKRRNSRKSASILLVPEIVSAPSGQVNGSSVVPQANVDLPPKIPRPMRPTLSDCNPLGVRNTDDANEPTGEAPAQRESDGKENGNV